MKFVPWVLAGALLVVAKAIASSIPPEQIPSEASTSSSTEVAQEPDLFDWLQPNIEKNKVESTRSTSQNDCKVANPAVVTIHAGKAFGSGSIVDASGLVITNNHVVRPAKGQDVGVRLASGTRYSGRVVAIDQMNDLALIKLNTRDRLPSIRLGASQAVQMGQSVCAIGSPFGRPGILTRGTLTTIRPNGDLQSALVLEPGNSGGPLLNQQGEMIGINKAIWQSRNGMNSGISFATNIDVARNFIERNGGTVDASRPAAYTASSVMVPSKRYDQFRSSSNTGSYVVPTEPFTTNFKVPVKQAASGPRLGVVLDKETLIIQQVDAISAASAAGLQAGDRLVAVNGNKLQNYGQLQEYLSNRPNSVVFTVNRNNQLQTVQINF